MVYSSLRATIFFVVLFFSNLLIAKELSFENIRLGSLYSNQNFQNYNEIARSSNPTGEHIYIKFSFMDLTEISITVRKSDKRIIFIEKDWFFPNPQADLNLYPFDIKNLVLGNSILKKVQNNFPFKGFHYKCVKDILKDGAFITIWSFENPTNSNQVINFVFKISKDFITEGLIPEYMLDKNIASIRGNSILVAAIIAEKEYLESIWCSEKNQPPLSLKIYS